MLLYSILKTSFQKIEPKRLIYRDYTSFSKDSFLTDLSNSIENSQCYDEAFETKTVEILDKHAPRKKKLLRRNHKPHVSKKLRKEIMARSRLKSIANKTGKDIDLYKFGKQRNPVNFNKKEKKNFLNSLSIGNDSKPFWETCKPYFLNKGIKSSGNIIISDKEYLILKEIEVMREFNVNFQSITSSLILMKWSDLSESLNESDPIKSVVNKDKNDHSIKKIKSKYIIVKLFPFRPVTAEDVLDVISTLDDTKSSGGDIPLRF